MAGLREKLTKKVGKVYTKVWDRLEPDGTTIALCKASETEDEFEAVLTIDSKRFFEYKSFREQFQLEIADDSPQLTAAMAEATHVKVDDDIYVIAKADTIPPKGVDVTWKIYCERFTTKSQTLTLM